RWRGRTKILVVPGGGPFADLVRLEYRRRKLSESAAHGMAILAMDQYGLYLSDLASRATPATSLSGVRAVLRSTRLPILLPSKLLFERDPFDHSWDVTSDSIAAYIARLVRADALLLLKDVDGIFSGDPRLDPAAPLLSYVARSRLGGFRCVDRQFGRWLRGVGSCWIVNGARPERVKEWLERGETVGTRVGAR
ncbi:MAG: hypothetical protein ACREJ4_11415, partial [Candidatus Methylomirabilaceae bacterium]